MASYYYHIVIELHDKSEAITKTAIERKLVPDILNDYTLPPPDANIFNLWEPVQVKPCTDPAEYLEKTSVPVQSPTRMPGYIDYRFSIVNLESIDMSNRRQAPGTDTPFYRSRGKSVSFTERTDSHALVTKARYVPITSSATNIGYGVVHLYRDKAETPGLFDPADNATASNETSTDAFSQSESSATGITQDDVKDDHTSAVVAILAVPAYMTPSDFLGFVGDDARESVSHFRLIRAGNEVRKYMALLKFRNEQDARKFAREYNGRVFNTMEPETCQVVFVRSVQIQVAEAENQKPTFRAFIDDPSSAVQTAQHDNDPPSYQQNASSIAMTTKPAPPPTASLLELPTCPVCLERMDDTTGLLTTQCQHVFHCACLSKWKDGSCPVCRYSSGDRINLPVSRWKRERFKSTGTEDDVEQEDDLEMCFNCGAVDNLWVCLICGHIGCGRYDEKHAYEHYERTQHFFAMDLESQRVWDYASDQYVHRLVQNKSDGKLVELPSGRHDENTEELYNKLDTVGMEYTYLLTSQLDSQRSYFEEQVLAAADKATKAARRADETSDKLRAALVELENMKIKMDELSQETVPSLEKSKIRAEKRLEKVTDLARKFEKDWKEEKTVNEGLLQRVETLNKQGEDLKQENVDLKDQIRDLMFFVEGREKLKEIGEEGVEEGEIRVGELSDNKKRRKGKGKVK